MESTRWSRLGALYAVTVFVSAFLLFQVQPLISRYILPWFGGTPAVWTTCLVFFQTVLFGGYAYAHVSEHYLRPRARTIVHLALIVLALFTLPIAPSDWWKPADSDYPGLRILALLAVCVGLPYFVLSSTGPLVQAWFSQTLPGKSPYRLYSLSNLGSLLALLSYPFMVEPLLDGHEQSWWWTAGFVLFCILSGTACWQTARLRGAGVPLAADFGAAPLDDAPAPSWLHRLLWLALPAFASILLLATTNHLCQDMPSSPLLWVFPLSLYLASFIIAFDHERWYWRLPYALAALVAIYLTAGMFNSDTWAAGWLGTAHDWIYGKPATPWKPWFSYEVDLPFQLAGLFALCMLCHGELARLRPKSSNYLTSFYLMISAGGALGGLSVSLVAPLVFKTYAEWKIGLVVGFVLAACVAFGLGLWQGGQRPQPTRRNLLRAGGGVVALLALIEIVYLLKHDELSTFKVLERSRDFYGVLSVIEDTPESSPYPARALYHGAIRHGQQFTDPAMKGLPATYYMPEGGLGQTIAWYRHGAADAHRPLRMGIVGMGVGTLLVYLDQPQDVMRFYEIDPEVVQLAEEYFTYLSDARQRNVEVEIVLGDARLSLERETSRPHEFDILALDAFSGDSIPTHLLTKEAFDVYQQHLASGGAIAVHISNRNLNLAPVVYGLAEYCHFDARRIFSVDARHGGWGADWVILSHNQDLLDHLHQVEGTLPRDPPEPPFPLWTDQRHNLLEVLR